MKHLDEGTIHAWLDGALDATQSAEVGAHVKDCAECSAQVAEARGLIAASSRILVALDDTPANVVPKPAVAPVRRRRGIAPWVSGLAAAAILITLWRTGDVQHPEPMADLRLPEVPRVVVPEPALGPVEQPAPPPATAPSTVTRNPVENQAKVGSVASGAGVAGGVASDLASVQVTSAPSAPAPAPTAVAGGVAIAGGEESQRREAFAAEAMRRAVSDTVTIEGCYPFLDAVVVTSANVAESRAPERQMRARGAPAPAVQKAAADAAVPAALRLDTAHVVRNVVSNQPIGSWSPVGADSARVTLGSNTVLLAKANKVRCP